MTPPHQADIYDTMASADQWTVPQLSRAVELRGWTCSDATALDALRDMRRGGYVCTDGKWRTDELWTRTDKTPGRSRGRHVLTTATETVKAKGQSRGQSATTWVWCKNTQQAVAYEAHHARGCACGGLERCTQ